MARGTIRVEYIDLDVLKRWPRNPKGHDLEGLSASVERFGFTQPLLVDERSGRLVAGHGRLDTLQQLKEAGKAPPARIRRKNGTWFVPVLRGVRFDSKTEAEAYLLADNRLVELGGWNEEMLVEVLKDLQQQEVPIIGWDEDELNRLLETQESVPPIEPDDGSLDNVPPLPLKPKTKPGKVIRLGKHRLHCKDCIEVMKELKDASIEAVVTDPPYGIGFMGKDWDCSVPGSEFAEQALRVLKPGGYLIAFGATRTIHRLTVALEDAGFEIRDQIGWLQWQGFPKSTNASKALDQAAGHPRGSDYQPNNKNNTHGKGWGGGRTTKQDPPVSVEAEMWEGWGTALKPAIEPAILARRPLQGTLAENLLKHGVGGLNIDACRLAYGDPAWPGPGGQPEWEGEQGWREQYVGGQKPSLRTKSASSMGRWPANIYHCPKPTRSEKEAGCEEIRPTTRENVTGRETGSAGQAHARSGMTRKGDIRNHHVSVKPIRLMRWLVRLVTPPGGQILEPFAGSGSTIVAAQLEGFRCLAVERDPAYCDIAEARVRALLRKL